ncbi:EAL domain, c-di-GMP-specific phosphodiesterase class I (or its enzymatically inactive variant) [Kosakonia oryzendophytica]|uniref:EAL domain, c-di-GMP-specific phosphodiesterase class I (Or its enzymatically inactive variant) n=1 Tax=Kosakonia oryzendophytica TaxID=1005665 RepID=A0A1C4BRS9_9ENTR|nr:diguanylate phosphodiesterase [Kosakonia oryzendophytica]AMO49504.1 BLUF domain/cyclic diguanylate phosphodiesterase domain protein [Enterobacter sp. FY-07]TDT59618.1 EAL domain-containing protein (putative c-di-GMP-specific phosphodiesterase class I) [Enterobacter sp. AG5470]WBT56046.1 diguanylate phosphodiesterase [Kosakonia oryzendophytica]SCC09473.1 EAL domain, c-di-GMP-specific phosphodiesterase class I (or its enzymatically inactive variant) [Kosakonia oryzendophytica]
MLATLIYRSRLNRTLDPSQLTNLVERASLRNSQLQVTGILLFDGDHFLQVLEGPLASVNAVFERIKRDHRHGNVVELLRDFAPRRRFVDRGMTLFDLRVMKPAAALRAILRFGTLRYQLASIDRVYKFIRNFIASQNNNDRVRSTSPEHWCFVCKTPPFTHTNAPVFTEQPCQFAFQPIIEPLRGNISSIEALIRGPNGGSPLEYFSSIPSDKLHEADLASKAWALAMASRMGIGNHKVAINLLPMSLVKIPGAVDILLSHITRNNLNPGQIIVEVTEDEVISGYEEFTWAIRQLRAAGIGLAIDDFGSGFAGLSLLAKFQPDKLKIDRTIVTDIHLHGPKQAIVKAIIDCCAELQITVVAEGVEKVEEWCWLEAVGIERFQGFLFARPVLNGISPINWPHRISR